MTINKINRDNTSDGQPITRRDALKLTASAAAATMAGILMPSLGVSAAPIEKTSGGKAGEEAISPKAFVYTELQISVPFEQAPWTEVNKALLRQPGLINKTWLAGVGNSSLGGIYAFDSIENAQSFVTGYFPSEARKFGVAQTTRVFDAVVVEEASRDMNSPHFGARLDRRPGAFVYTEVQVNVPFSKAPWRARNPILRQQPGLLAKTWLSGLHTNTLGGIDAFDTIENAQAFVLSDFPRTAAKLNAAFYTRVFDAELVVSASRQMHSPFFM